MDFYKKCISIVKQYTKSNVELAHVTQFDAQANTNILVEKLFLESPSINQFNTCSNHKCGQTITGLPLFPIDLMQLVKGNFIKTKILAMKVIIFLSIKIFISLYYIGLFHNMQDAINDYPSQLAFYKRPCLRDGCKGTQTITTILGNHIIIDTVMDTFDRNSTLICYLNVSKEISIENNK